MGKKTRKVSKKKTRKVKVYGKLKKNDIEKKRQKQTIEDPILKVFEYRRRIRENNEPSFFWGGREYFVDCGWEKQKENEVDQTYIKYVDVLRTNVRCRDCKSKKVWNTECKTCNDASKYVAKYKHEVVRCDPCTRTDKWSTECSKCKDEVQWCSDPVVREMFGRNEIEIYL